VEKKERIKGVDNGHKECVNHFLKYLTRPRDTEVNEPNRDPDGEIVSYQPLSPFQMKIFIDRRLFNGITRFKFDSGIWEGNPRSPVIISMEFFVSGITINPAPRMETLQGESLDYEINLTTLRPPT
jgi:hypothetical protein